jgi:hypothetical protein
MNAILLILVYVLFLLPKINLVSVGNFNAGLRVDDVVIAAAAAILVGRKVLQEGAFISLSRAERWFWLFCVACLVSAVWNAVAFNRGSVLFPLRFAEYFVFFYIGWSLASKQRDVASRLLMTVFWANVAIAALQLTGFIGGFTVRGYTADVSERVVGLTSGPWELGVLLNLVTCMVLAHKGSLPKKVMVFSIATFFILANGSRMSLLAQVAILGASIIFSGGVVKSLKAALFAAPAVALVAVLFAGSGVATRSASLSSMDNVSLLVDAFAHVQATERAPSWEDLGVLSRDDGVDASWSMRGPKWIYSVKMWALNPANVTVGVGPGTFGNALDGGWLRLLTETGLLGLSFFLLFMNSVFRQGGALRLAVVAISVNMFFIDIYMAYKVMSVFLFFCGFWLARNARLATRVGGLPTSAFPASAMPPVSEVGLSK